MTPSLTLIITPFYMMLKWLNSFEVGTTPDATIPFIAANLACLFTLLIPSMVAFARGHRSRWAILALNVIFLPLTVFWIWALIWALTGNVRTAT